MRFAETLQPDGTLTGTIAQPGDATSVVFDGIQDQGIVAGAFSDTVSGTLLRDLRDFVNVQVGDPNQSDPLKAPRKL